MGYIKDDNIKDNMMKVEERKILLKEIKVKLDESFTLIENNLNNGSNNVNITDNVIDKEIEKTYSWLVDFETNIHDEIILNITKQLKEILLLIAVENVVGMTEFKMNKVKFYVDLFRNKMKEWNT